jgi:hypothetical protein
MGFWAKDTINAATDVANLDYPNIRLMYVGLTTTPASNNDFGSMCFSWMAANTQVLTTYGFSGVCWFCGQRVYDGLGGTVPIGESRSCFSHAPVNHATATFSHAAVHHATAMVRRCAWLSACASTTMRWADSRPRNCAARLL